MAVKKVRYADKQEMLEEIIKSKKKLAEYPPELRKEMAPQCITPRLVEIIMQLVKNYASRSNWNRYSWNEDMQGDALLNFCKAALKFDETMDNPNPFGYYTQTARRSFLTTNSSEKKETTIRDDLIQMEDTKMMPSFARQNATTYAEADAALDGTKRVKSDMRRRRARKLECKPEDDYQNMTKAEQAEWLAKKVADFKKSD